MSQTIIGLDIGHYSIKALKLNVGYRELQAEYFDEAVLDVVLPELAALERARLADAQDDAEGDAAEEAPITEEEIEDALHDAEDEAYYAAMQELHERGSLEADAFAVALPADLLMSHDLQLPFNDPQKLKMVVPSEFEERIPVDLDELLLDHHVVGQSATAPGMFDIHVAATKLDDLSVYLDRWQSAGIDPHYILSPDAALLHLARHLLADLREPFALVDLGHRFTRVACIEHDPAADTHLLGQSRSIQFGGHNLTRAIQNALDCDYKHAERVKHTEAGLPLPSPIPDASPDGPPPVPGDDPTPEALASLGAHPADAVLERAAMRLVRELRTTFHRHATARRTGVQRVYLLGGSSKLTNLRPWLEHHLGVPVDMLSMASEPLMALDNRAPRASSHVFGLPLALGLREALPAGQRSELNFRRGPFAHTQSRSWLREKIPSLAFFAVAILLALVGLFASSYYAIEQERQATETSLKMATLALFDEEIVVPSTIKKRLQSGDDGPNLIPKNSAHDFFFEVVKRIPEDLQVDLYGIDVDIDRQIIKVDGNTSSAADVDRIVESLEGFACFKGQVQKGTVDSLGDDKVKFDLSIAPQCSAPDKKDKGKKK